MRLFPAIIAATLSGYVAISHEIVWYRIYGFIMESRAGSFGLVLAAYLAGLAIGAFAAGRYCRSGAGGTPERSVRQLGILLLLANCAAYLTIPVLAVYAQFWPHLQFVSLALILAATVLLGTVLPLLAHAAVAADSRAGHRFAFIYAGNIMGSVAGGLVTGFFLFDILGLPQISMLLGLTGLSLGGVVILSAPARTSRRIQRAGGVLATMLILAAAAPGLYKNVYSKLHHGGDYGRWGTFQAIYETSSGVVTLSRSGNLYSGGAYEGRFNVSPLPGVDENRVIRAYLTAAFHPAPKDILFIGLGSGSWAQVLAHNPNVESITIVEINPGFIQAVRDRSAVASLLTNPKVKIVQDDGRRFLRRTQRHFDLVVQNTIVFWRTNATNLLSREYLELSRTRLKTGGRLYINTTRSTLAQKTVITVFPHALRYENMIIAGNDPVHIDRARFQQQLLHWRIDGQRVVPGKYRGLDLFQLLIKPAWLSRPTWESRSEMAARTRNLPIITDTNLGTEFGDFDAYPEVPKDGQS